MVRFIDRDVVSTIADTSFVRTKYLDVPYANGERNKLDIYLPNEEKDCYPVIIDVYGGGLFFGKKSSTKMNGALELLKRGYAVVSPDYSLSYMDDFPKPVYELKSVVRFIKANAKKFHFNNKQVFFMGQSSGAQLVMLAATSEADGKLKSDLGGNTNFSSQVNGVIASYGPYDLAAMPAQFAALNETPKFSETGEADSFEGMMLGHKKPLDFPKLNAAANPATYLNEKMVPVLFYAGTGDRVVPYIQTINLAAKTIEKIGSENVKTHIIRNAPHGESGFLNKAVIDQKDQFIQEIIKRR